MANPDGETDGGKVSGAVHSVSYEERLRDHFAGLALASLLTSSGCAYEARAAADVAFSYADEMIRTRGAR
jgi:hypothetical protein